MKCAFVAAVAVAVLATTNAASASPPSQHTVKLLDARTGRVLQSVSVPAGVTDVVFLDPRTGRRIPDGSSGYVGNPFNPLWLRH
jgi:hypothetical protein